MSKRQTFLDSSAFFHHIAAMSNFSPEKRSIVIIGSGPAGISTALSLKKLDSVLAGDIVVLEKAKHPRRKLCGGGLTALAERMLYNLEVDVKTPGAPIHRVEFHVRGTVAKFERENMMRIIQRSEFDHALVENAREAGIEIRENEAVTDIFRENDKVRVITTKSEYHACVVVGADGAKSILRKRFFRESKGRVSRLLEKTVSVNEKNSALFGNTAVFEFCPKDSHLQGYMWDFPCLAQGKPSLNVGIFDSRVHDYKRADLNALLNARLASRNDIPETGKPDGHPERWFTPDAAYAKPNLLLVGDAAGIEPWLGEGISIALAYGPVAAAEIVAAFQTRNFAFANYRQRIIADKLGHLLNRNRKIAKMFYARMAQPFLPAMARFLEFYLKSIGTVNH